MTEDHIPDPEAAGSAGRWAQPPEASAAPHGWSQPPAGQPRRLYGSTESTIIETITHGRNNKMPAFGDFLGEDKVHILTAYVLTLNKK